jgi:hypothetical protein
MIRTVWGLMFFAPLGWVLFWNAKLYICLGSLFASRELQCMRGALYCTCVMLGAMAIYSYIGLSVCNTLRTFVLPPFSLFLYQL